MEPSGTALSVPCFAPFISASRDLAEGDGTMGMLLRDPKFHEALLLTTERLGEAARELQVLVKQWQDKGLLSGR